VSCDRIRHRERFLDRLPFKAAMADVLKVKAAGEKETGKE
jgi:hypothetical protein